MDDVKVAQPPRVCTICGVAKEISDFSAHKRSAGGRRNQCKECSAAQARKWRSLNPEKVKENNSRNQKKMRAKIGYKRQIKQNEDGRLCGYCKTRKPINKFGACATAPNALDWTCLECKRVQIKAYADREPERARTRAREYARTQRIRHPERTSETQRRVNLKSKYGLSVDEFSKMVEKQGFKCAICFGVFETGQRKMLRPCVDHDHATGVVRQILCGKCNRGIGLLLDSEEIIESALSYIRRHNK